MDKICARILLLGKTGAGKSSFVNYLLDRDVAETGVGKPVTQGMFSYKLEYEDVNLEIYDSKGIEVENSDEIKREIEFEVRRRNQDKNILNWFHTIFYCISMSKNRIEDSEIDFIKILASNINQKIHIILTNCDTSSEDKIEKFMNYIHQRLGNDVCIYKVCSVSIKKMSGAVIEPYGKEEILKNSFDLLWNDISMKVSKDFSEEITKTTIQDFDEVYSSFKEIVLKNVNLFTLLTKSSEIESKLHLEFKDNEERFKNMIKEIDYKINNKWAEKVIPLNILYSSYYSSLYKKEIKIENIIDEVIKEIYDMIDMDKIFRNTDISKIFINNEDSTNVNTNAKIIFKMIWSTIKIGKTVSDSLDQVYNQIKAEILKYPLEQNIYKKMKKLVEL